MEQNDFNQRELYDPTLDIPNYKIPSLHISNSKEISAAINKEKLERNKNIIIHTLHTFKIQVERITIKVGPTLTTYEIIVAEGITYSQVKRREEDLRLSLAAEHLYITTIPQNSAIGIEVLNDEYKDVSLPDIISSNEFEENNNSLPIIIGKEDNKKNLIIDLVELIHLLIIGASQQGKSTELHSIIISLLCKKHPSQLKFVMIDPKKVELSLYHSLEKHFLAKLPYEKDAIVTDIDRILDTINSLNIEMDNRFELLKEAHCRNIQEYNGKFINRELAPEEGHKFLPFILLIIDEFSDIITLKGTEIEAPITRLLQLAHKVGIHLIIATTPRTTTNIITRNIKTNFPAKIVFNLNNNTDLHNILNKKDISPLYRAGDMYLQYPNNLLRIQGPNVTLSEIEEIVESIAEQRGYPAAFELPEYGDYDLSAHGFDLSNRDKLFEDCARVVVQTQSGSTSMLQRRFNLGYNRVGRIMDQLEAAGIVGPSMGSKPRDVIYKTENELEHFLSELI